MRTFSRTRAVAKTTLIALGFGACGLLTCLAAAQSGTEAIVTAAL